LGRDRGLTGGVKGEESWEEVGYSLKGRCVLLLNQREYEEEERENAGREKKRRQKGGDEGIRGQGGRIGGHLEGGGKTHPECACSFMGVGI